MQEQLEDTNDDEEVAPDEPSSSGHVVNTYQCSQEMPKMNTKKQPQKKNDHYNLRSKWAPLTLGEAQENMRLLMRKVDPLATPKQKTQSKSQKIVADKSMSMSSKLQNTPPDNMDIRSTPDTSVRLPPMEYNIVDDMNKNQVNISLFELAEIQSERDILLRALGQITMDNTTSTNKGEIARPRSLYIVLNMLWMEEAKSGCPQFLLSFEIFNYNVRNCLVDFDTVANIITLSIAKKVNADWSKPSARII